mgnify:CR=1 FL=1
MVTALPVESFRRDFTWSYSIISRHYGGISPSLNFGTGKKIIYFQVVDHMLCDYGVIFGSVKKWFHGGDQYVMRI